MSALVPAREEENRMLRAALGYVDKLGWSVFPCRARDKVPLTAHGVKDATKDPAVIRAWWAQWRDANIGVPTGEPNNFFALDVDERDGVSGNEALARLEAKHSKLPVTVGQRTPSGGRHLLFRANSRRIRNSAGKLGPGLDVRADAGYIVVSPSIGQNGERYSWRDDARPGEIAIADAPQWLLDLLAKPKPIASPSPSHHLAPLPGRASAYAEAALEKERANVALALTGNRNEILNRAAFSLGQLVAANTLPRERVEGALLDAATRCGLVADDGEAAVRRTIQSGLEAGMKEPRPIPEPAHHRSSLAMPRESTVVVSAWSDPLPLPDELPEVPELDAEILPDALRPWLVDIAERMQVKLDFVGTSAMVVLGAVVGRQLCIRPKKHDDWMVAPNLWGAIVGRPGLLKTPALAEVMAPLYRLEDAARERYEREVRDYDAQKILAQEARKGASEEIRKSLKGGKRKEAHAQAVELVEGEPEEPARRRFVTNDTSVEKLGELLHATSRGVLVFRDELVGLLRNLDKQGQESARAFYLEAWSGLERFTYDRIGRGTIDIPSACVSVLGGIQPGPLGTYLADAISGGQGDDGLLQRFQLVSWPDPPAEWVNVDREPDAKAKAAAFEVFARLDQIEPEAIGAVRDGGPAFLRFDGGAQALFDDWRTDLESRIRRGAEHPAIEAHLSKFRKVVPTLALLTHLANGGRGPVSEMALAAALAWAAYLEDHARRLYASRLGVGATGTRELFRHLRRGDLPDPFTARDTTRKHWTGLDAETVLEALDDLVARGWLRAEPINTGGRPTTQYHHNPVLKRVGP